LALFLSHSMPPSQSTTTLFPYTTLSRSRLDNIQVVAFIHGKESVYPFDVGYRSQWHRVGGAHQRIMAKVDGPDMTVDRATYGGIDRKSTRLISSHVKISYAVFCLKKKKI